MDLFFRGVVIGLSIAAPVGPIGVICIRHSLVNGWKVGLAAGLGAACADGLYAIAAVLGLAMLTKVFAALTLPLHIVGGLLLFYIAFKVLNSSVIEAKLEDAQTPAQKVDQNADPHSVKSSSQISLAKALLQTFALTITNPMTILSFSAILSAFGVEQLSLQSLYVVSGVFAGSALWWLALSAGTSKFSRLLTPRGNVRYQLLFQCDYCRLWFVVDFVSPTLTTLLASK